MDDLFVYSQAIVLGRESRGLSQRQLAKESLIPISRIKEMELTPWTTEIDVTPKELNNLAAVLRYPLAFFQKPFQLYPVRFCCLCCRSYH